MELDDQFMQQTDNGVSKDRWLCLTVHRWELETGEETLIIAAQDQSVRTNLIKEKIEKTYSSSKSRICRKGKESMNCLLNECCLLTENEYKRRDNCIGKRKEKALGC